LTTQEGKEKAIALYSQGKLVVQRREGSRYKSPALQGCQMNLNPAFSGNRIRNTGDINYIQDIKTAENDLFLVFCRV
jgi:hypothetical protein